MSSVVNGKILMRDRKLQTIDEMEVMEKAKEYMERQEKYEHCLVNLAVAFLIGTYTGIAVFSFTVLYGLSGYALIRGSGAELCSVSLFQCGGRIIMMRGNLDEKRSRHSFSRKLCRSSGRCKIKPSDSGRNRKNNVIPHCPLSEEPIPSEKRKKRRKKKKREKVRGFILLLAL